MHAIVQKMDQKREKSKNVFEKKMYLEIWAKMYKFENILKKGSPSCDYRMYQTARICPDKAC